MDDSKTLREQIRKLERMLGVLNDSEMSCCNVTMAQCHAIVEIGRAGSLSLVQLSEILNLDTSTTSRTVNNLVTRNLATRDPDPDDRRFIQIALTDSGIQIFNQIETNMDAHFSVMYQKITPEKRVQVLESIQILLDVFNTGNCC